MKYKRISGFSSKILTEMNEIGKTWFMLSDIYSLFPDLSKNNIRVGIKRMCENGLLLHVCEGTYYIVPFEQDSNTYLPDWHLLVEPLAGCDHYIGYNSALQIHGLITQPSLKEYIVSNIQRKPSVIYVNETCFQFIYHNNRHFFGYEKMWINQHDQVLCSDVEKTIIDCLYRPGYAGGIVEIAKALFFAQKKINYEQLFEYTTRFGVKSVIKRLGYLLELLEIETPIIESLREMRSSSVSSLDPEAPRTGKVHPRWNIIQNIEAETVKGAIYT